MLANTFFHMLNNIKLYHWKTTSFARHKAMDDLHGSMSDLVDQFMEVYIGKYGRTKINSMAAVTIKNINDDNAEEHIRNWVKFLESGLVDFVDEYDSDLLNIRDEMLGLLNKTLYLCTLN